ncbi:MAG: hypothetical protein JWQ20_2645 [Conexibacter sp.]|jgi:hypothetical protein|nr:hypothetical protein [Conexibacter sp.]
MSVACGRYDAAFTLDDPDVLVGAALSCPACLDSGTRLTVGMTDDRLDARCACLGCGSTWSLTLAPQQALRLSLDPPRSADVHFSAQLPPALMPFDVDDLDG